MRKYYNATILGLSREIDENGNCVSTSSTNLGSFIVTKALGGVYREISTGKVVGKYTDGLTIDISDDECDYKRGRDYSTLFVYTRTLEEIPKGELEITLRYYMMRDKKRIDSIFTREELLNGGIPSKKEFFYGKIIDLHDDSISSQNSDIDLRYCSDDFGNYILEKIGKNEYREVLTGHIFGSFRKKMAFCKLPDIDSMQLYVVAERKPSRQHKYMLVDETGIKAIPSVELSKHFKEYMASVDRFELASFFKNTEKDLAESYKAKEEDKKNTLTYAPKTKQKDKMDGKKE